MKKHLFRKLAYQALLPILPIIVASAPLSFLASCSDSERRMPADNTSRVLIDIGDSPAKSGRAAASAPSDLESVTITVTGPGMSPMTSTFTAVSGTIDLSVPSGPARLFAAEATTTGGSTYSGKAIATLPAGQTVSIPIVMLPGGLFGPGNEGTPENPVFVQATELGNIPRIGQVGNGISYYYTDPGTYQMLSIKMSNLTDDADLFSFGTDSSFSAMYTINFGVNYCGRTSGESVSDYFSGGFSNDYPGLYYYFAVDGSHTKNGATYSLAIASNNGLVDNGPIIGTLLAPNIVPVGLPYNTGVRIGNLINRYTAVVSPGTEYWVNGYNFDGTPTITIFNSLDFTSPVTSPFVANYRACTFMVSEIGVQGTDSFTLEVVANEGSIAEPILLYPDETYLIGRANYCMVGGNLGSSYYKVPITGMQNGMSVPGYIVSVTSILSDVDLYIYSDSGFTSQISGSPSNSTGTSDEALYPIYDYFPDGYMYIEVRDNNGSGSTFVLSIFNRIS